MWGRGVVLVVEGLQLLVAWLLGCLLGVFFSLFFFSVFVCLFLLLSISSIFFFLFDYVSSEKQRALVVCALCVYS